MQLPFFTFCRFKFKTWFITKIIDDEFKDNKKIVLKFGKITDSPKVYLY